MTHFGHALLLLITILAQDLTSEDRNKLEIESPGKFIPYFDAGPGGYIPISIRSDAVGLRKVFRRIFNLWKESRRCGRIPEQITLIPEY